MPPHLHPEVEKVAVLVCPPGGLQEEVFAAPCLRQLCRLRNVVPVHTDEAILRVKDRGGSAWEGGGRQDLCAPRGPTHHASLGPGGAQAAEADVVSQEGSSVLAQPLEVHHNLLLRGAQGSARPPRPSGPPRDARPNVPRPRRSPRPGSASAARSVSPWQRAAEPAAPAAAPGPSLRRRPARSRTCPCRRRRRYRPLPPCRARWGRTSSPGPSLPLVEPGPSRQRWQRGQGGGRNLLQFKAGLRSARRGGSTGRRPELPSRGCPRGPASVSLLLPAPRDTHILVLPVLSLHLVSLQWQSPRQKAALGGCMVPDAFQWS